MVPQERIGETMKKLLQILAKVPLPMIAVVGLVMVVLVFANPWVLLSDTWSGMTEEVTSGNESTVVTDVKTMGKLKVLKRFVGGFLEVPSDKTENEEDRKNFRVVYQWEGSAEFTIDLTHVVRDTNTVNGCEVLHMPKIEIENLRDLPISGTRCVIKRASLGYGDMADAISGSMPQLIGKKIKMEVDTKENVKKAREQAEYLLSSMLKATRPDVRVEFDWGD